MPGDKPGLLTDYKVPPLAFAPCSVTDDAFKVSYYQLPAAGTVPDGVYQATPGQTFVLYPQYANASTLVYPVSAVVACTCRCPMHKCLQHWCCGHHITEGCKGCSHAPGLRAFSAGGREVQPLEASYSPGLCSMPFVQPEALPTQSTLLTLLAPSFLQTRDIPHLAAPYFAGINPLNSSQYAAELEYTYELGSINSTSRTPYQTDTAKFWLGAAQFATSLGECLVC